MGLLLWLLELMLLELCRGLHLLELSRGRLLLECSRLLLRMNGSLITGPGVCRLAGQR